MRLKIRDDVRIKNKIYKRKDFVKEKKKGKKI